MNPTVEAKIRGLATFYQNGLERFEIHIKKQDAKYLPYIENEAVPIELCINDTCYDSLLRSTAKNKYVWISPKLITKNEEKETLANVLLEEGFQKNQTVSLKVDGKIIHVTD